MRRNGAPVVYLRSIDEIDEGFGGFGQKLPADRFLGTRVRLSGWLKTQDLSHWAGLWMRVDGAEKGTSLAFDDMRDRGIRGSQDWREYEVTLNVPDEAKQVVVGFLLVGEGSIWVSNLHVEVVSEDFAATAGMAERSSIGDALVRSNGRSSSRTISAHTNATPQTIWRQSHTARSSRKIIGAHPV